ncbi:M81 family metallopeptidase [Mesorhizobium sp. M4A.F.Ca.ET.050.02.1.1]|uniref:M81 family metallopeptidase n=1 Tax=Mesorhizobium sp. M4A.F.Ca.ET.050.02.1.1 TaxID=2496754 RepID=UPI00167E3CE0|nr:M81 family metallopeptidase [Mesorhizobium sp. M4A.F.Ca.ET.050.02.1.1]
MRVLIGQLNQETHSFNPIETTREDFIFDRGPELIIKNCGRSTAIGGMVRAADDLGVTLLPAIAALGRSGGPVCGEVYEEFKELILKAIEETCPDAVCLDLHGAMATREIEDCEGDLLTTIRDRFKSLPVGAALDLDGQLTTRMVEAADILIGYKTNPHSDIADTGAATLHTLVNALRSGKRIIRAFAKMPFLLQGRISTTEFPYAPIYERARKLCEENPDLLDITIFNGQQFLDISESGQAVLVTYDGSDKTVPEAACLDISSMLLQAKGDFIQYMPTLEQCFERMATERTEQPLILGDFGDRVLTGAPGDSTEIISYALNNYPAIRGACVVFDPTAFQQCQRAGESASLPITFGGKFTPNMSPVTALVTVRKLTDGNFVNHGPYMEGVPGALGPTAYVTAGALSILITSLSPMVQDPSAYETFGISLSEMSFAVAKSGSHFRLNFAAIGQPLVVGTDGLTSFNLRSLPYRKSRFALPREDWPPNLPKLLGPKTFSTDWSSLSKKTPPRAG